MSRIGRGLAWVAFPPLGLWRSARHGREQANIRQAARIRGEEPRKLSLPERIEAHARKIEADSRK